MLESSRPGDRGRAEAALAFLAGAAGVGLWVGMTLLSRRTYHFHPFFIGALVPWVFSLRRSDGSTRRLWAAGIAVGLLVLGAAIVHDAYLHDHTGRPGDSPLFVLSMYVAGFSWTWLWRTRASKSRGRVAAALGSGSGLLLFLPTGLLAGWALSVLGP